MRKFFVILLCLIFTFSFSAPRAAATGVGAGLTAAEMAGVIAVIAASLGVTFMSAEDMQAACNAFVGDVVPGSPTDVLLSACGVSDGYIYLRGEIAKTEMMAVISAVRSFFIPGDNVVVEGSGVNITNLGQIASSSGAITDSVAKFTVTETPVIFRNANGDFVGSVSISRSSGGTGNDYWGSFVRYNYDVLTITAEFGTKDDTTVVNDYSQYAPSFLYFARTGMNNDFIAPFIRFHQVSNGAAISMRVGPPDIRVSLVASVSGGGEEAIDIPVFQEAGALSPDLVGGVWDQLAQDADEQNGNVIIDTNTPSFQGGSSGIIPGAPDNNLVNPQRGALDSIGSTKTETDTSTGTQTQTQTQTGAQAVPNSATANPAISDTKAETSLDGVALTLVDIFPFCIPFDVYAMITSLAAPRETPTFDVRLFYPGWVDYTYTFDFSDFDNIAAVLRTAELGAFCVGLAAATRKFIKW